MTPEDLSMLRAQIALLKTTSPTKGASRRYGEEELKAAIVGMGARLAESTFKNPIPRRAA